MRISARFILYSAKGLLLGLFIASTALAQTKPKVAFVPQIVGIPYFNAMEEGGKDAAEKFGVDFIYTGPTDTNPADQLRIVNGLIDQGVNAVSLSVLDASSIDPILNKAKDKGIHIFTSDSDAPKSAREVYVAEVAGLLQPVKYDAATKVLLLGPPTVFTKENVDQFSSSRVLETDVPLIK
jgi:ABC-type sugar transport system substrate-binding protein